MKYKIYKLNFTTGVHFGNNTLESCEITLCADTIFSAICHEIAKRNENEVEDFVDKVKKGKILISDAFPYIRNTYYVPKPMVKVDSNEKNGDSILKKLYKKMMYVPVDKLDGYINGKLDVEKEVNIYKNELGKKLVRVSASVRNEEDKTLPYRIGVYNFNENCGLYIIVGYMYEEDLSDIEGCLMFIGMSGIGGKRSAGLGRYELIYGKDNELFFDRINKDSKLYMTLSVCLPRKEELNDVINNANYLMKKRSGFISSTDTSVCKYRKKDMYVMQSGSCFESKFEGDVYDVGLGVSHPVYRYAKPMFMGVIW